VKEVLKAVLKADDLPAKADVVAVKAQA